MIQTCSISSSIIVQRIIPTRHVVWLVL